ncbi:MAG: exodeoxyribonuclease V subunit alpha [Spirochaetaceae bacterium]
MKKQYGSALREFLKNRDYSNASPDLKKLYAESKTWDSFITDAKVNGFKWSQIYFVKELLDRYKCNNPDLLKWFLLHIMYQYDVGNLRTSIITLEEDIKEWYSEELTPFLLSDLLTSVHELIVGNIEIFGSENEPFLIEGNYIYINRIEKYEEEFLALLSKRLTSNIPNSVDITAVKKSLEDRMEYGLDGARLEAVEKALNNNFLIISGGPGTGKTTTVVSIIRGLLFMGINNISLAAPTGRAAKRMIESIRRETTAKDEQMPTEAFTLHKLLGIIPNKDRPRYNSDRLLPTEAVIIDEASMVDIHMMYRLFDALHANTKLILVGDKDQLPSVEAGALLGDFLHNYKDPKHKMFNSIIILEKFYRSTEGIMDGAKLVIGGDSTSALDYLKKGSSEIITSELPETDKLVSILIGQYNKTGLPLNFSIPVSRYTEVSRQIEQYFSLYADYTVLSPSKKGLYGTYSLNSLIKRVFNPHFKPFYHGEPIMITKNDYVNGLFNGDRGVILGFTNGLYAFFKEVDSYKVVSISKIIDYETSYVGTVHKSQGSEFKHVAIIIPEGSEKLLTREILYTALTRAKKQVYLYAGDEQIVTAVKKRIKRESGIRDFLLD